MSRSSIKKVLCDASLLRRLMHKQMQIRSKLLRLGRRSTIFPSFVGLTIAFTMVENMFQYTLLKTWLVKLGEFVPTRTMDTNPGKPQRNRGRKQMARTN